MRHGFHLDTLLVAGKEKQDAYLHFQAGLNVVTGPSDTGKSYVLKCIDYMLGSSKKPKSINESKGYSTAFLTIRTMSDQFITLERALKGGSFRCYFDHALPIPVGQEGEVLGGKHKAEAENTVSALLLRLTNLTDKKILTGSKDGTTRSLSFRDLVDLVIVDENRIFVQESPIYSGQYTEKTGEASVLRLLVTGQDDSSIIGKKEALTQRAQLEGKIQLYEQLIASSEQELASLTTDRSGLVEQVERADSTIEGLTKSLETHQAQLIEQEQIRRNAWEGIQKHESRRIVINELLDRFSLLQTHYRSDLARLSAIREANRLFFQTASQACPLCGIVSDERPTDGMFSQDRIDEACNREMSKILTLLNDLDGTTSQLRKEDEDLLSETTRLRGELASAVRHIQEVLEPSARRSHTDIQELLDLRKKLERATQLSDLLSTYTKNRDRLSLERKSKKTPKLSLPSSLRATEMEGVCREAEELLQSWGYPDSGRVVFSELEQDLIINGRERKSPGKGFRALSYAAFTIGLMRFCFKAGLPHPGFVILDSPLVTFRKPDSPADRLEDDVKVAFYTTLANTPHDQQILILENEDPPADVHANINYVHFTKSSKVGRYGFFPLTTTPKV